MTHSLNIGKEPSLQKIVIASAVLHLFFIALVVIPIKTKERDFRGYHVKLVGPIQTPGTGQASLIKKKIKRKIPQKKVAKRSPKADMSLERADKVAKEIERIRAISTLSKRKREKGKAKEIEVIKKGVYEGEGISRGSGIPGKGTNMDSDSYYALLTRKIWGQWVYPDFESAGLEMIISIKIDKDGKIISQEIERSSGNMLFDRSAMKAISKASPLPAPLIPIEIGVRFYL